MMNHHKKPSWWYSTGSLFCLHNILCSYAVATIMGCTLLSSVLIFIDIFLYLSDCKISENKVIQLKSYVGYFDIRLLRWTGNRQVAGSGWIRKAEGTVLFRSLEEPMARSGRLFGGEDDHYTYNIIIGALTSSLEAVRKVLVLKPTHEPHF